MSKKITVVNAFEETFDLSDLDKFKEQVDRVLKDNDETCKKLVDKECVNIIETEHGLQFIFVEREQSK